MLEFRALADSDLPLAEAWLNKAHVKRWYEIPELGITIQDWMAEMREREGTFRWLTHLIALWQGRPMGLCQYYRCADSDEDFGTLPPAGAYGIDYLIGEESCLGRGLGKEMIALLVDTIFAFPDAGSVTADIDRKNTASQKALLSCGFALLDAGGSRYVIHKESWRKNKE